MKFVKMLESTTKALSDVDVGGKRTDSSLVELDRGILQVALMVSGLDGTILPAEYEAFGEMAKRCRGASAKSVRALYDAAIVKAGQLAGMARSGVYSETDRLSAFVRLAAQAMPKGFGCGSLADLRRAVAFWIAMGVSDGAFSGMERKAIQVLVRRYALARAAKAKKFTALLEPDFSAKVEKLLGDMYTPSKRARAEAALNALVSTVEVREKDAKVIRPAKRVALAFSGPGPTVSTWGGRMRF